MIKKFILSVTYNNGFLKYFGSDKDRIFGKGNDYLAFSHFHSFPNIAEIYNCNIIEASIKNYSQKCLKRAKIAVTKLTIDQALKQGVDAHKAGKVHDAHRLYTAILKARPKHPDANHNIGLLLVGFGKTELALKFFKTALEANPSNVQFWYSHIVAYFKLERLIDAKILLNEAKSKGIKGADFDKLEQRLNKAKNTQTIKPDYVDAYYNMGNAFLGQHKLEEAIEAYKKAITIKPDNIDAYYNMGNAFLGQHNLEEAIEAYKKAITIKPDYVDAYYNMGIALKNQGNLEEAIQAYKKVLAFKPDNVDAYSLMGIALQDQGKLEEAIEAYKNAITIKPDYVDAHQNLSFALLNSGRLREGFEEYEWRWKNAKSWNAKRQFSMPMWDGKETLKGKKVLLWCEQGVGDTINWSSRLPLIVSQADHCILECQEKLLPLLSRSFPNLEIKAENRGQDSKRDDFDFHLPMGSLYEHFISEISANTKPNAFLAPDPVRVKFWRKRLESLSNGPFIGVSWKSAHMSPERLPNYAPISDWLPIFAIPGVTFINLQYTDFLDDLNEIKNKYGVTIHNFDDLDHYNDLHDVAALCAALDIVVSTKITVPLISAGVGTITKLANWRQSPWNNILLNPAGPLVDIFEKNTLEPWYNLFNTIAEDIMTFSNNYNNT